MSKLDIDNMFSNSDMSYFNELESQIDSDYDYGYCGGSSSGSKNDNDGWKDDYIGDIPKDINTYQDAHLKGDLSLIDIINTIIDLAIKY